MAEAAEQQFWCEVSEAPGEDGRVLARVVCHGRLVAGSGEPLRAAVQPLINRGGTTVLDLGDVAYMDSMGLGILVSLKVSSVHKGYGHLDMINLTPRIKELLRITKLTEYLARPDTVNYGG